MMEHFLKIINYQWAQFICVILLSLSFSWLLKKGLNKLAPYIKSSVRISPLVSGIIHECALRTQSWVIFFVLLTGASHTLELNEKILSTTKTLLTIALTFQVIYYILGIVREVRDKVIAEKIKNNASSAASINLMTSGVEFLLITILILVGLSNLGINITAFIAGLGIGGIAIALAVQNILSDLFSSISIVLDKPFVVGDNITVGSDSGIVEHIGIKTTRVRATSGEELIFSNKDILSNRIHNFKRMIRRRVEKKVSLSRDGLTIEQIQEIAKGLEECLVNPKTQLSYCRVAQIESDVEFEIVFHITDPNFNKFIDIQEEFIFAVLRKFPDKKMSITSPKKNENKVQVVINKE